MTNSNFGSPGFLEAIIEGRKLVNVIEHVCLMGGLFFALVETVRTPELNYFILLVGLLGSLVFILLLKIEFFIVSKLLIKYEKLIFKVVMPFIHFIKQCKKGS